MTSHKRIFKDQAPEGFDLKHFSVNLPITYRHDPVDTLSLDSPPAKELILGLHGFTDSAKALQRRLGDFSSLSSAARLFPNGPFPLPVRIEGGYKEAYAWYFFDMDRNRVVISPDPALTLIQSLVRELGYEDTPKTLIGFSQGGFLAPFLAASLKNVRRMICIGSGYRVDDYVSLGELQVFGLHGEKDEVISVERSRQQFQALQNAGVKGQWIEFKDLKHSMDDASRSRLLEILRQPLWPAP